MGRYDDVELNPRRMVIERIQQHFYETLCSGSIHSGVCPEADKILAKGKPMREKIEKAKAKLAQEIAPLQKQINDLHEEAQAVYHAHQIKMSKLRNDLILEVACVGAKDADALQAILAKLPKL